MLLLRAAIEEVMKKIYPDLEVTEHQLSQNHWIFIDIHVDKWA